MIFRLRRWLWTRWWESNHHEIEPLLQSIFDSRVRPAMDESFQAGVEQGIHWTLTALLKEPFITALPELEQWARDQRALIEERRA